MTVIKATTKRGQGMLYSAARYCGYKLSDVYDSYSPAKARAYEYCFEQYASDKSASNFHISSFNTFGFSVAWECEEGTRIETPKNSYLITY